MEPSTLPMPTLPQSDHDLLIRVDTTLGHLRDDFKSLTDTTKNDVADLKATKLDKGEFEQWKKDAYAPLDSKVEIVGRQTNKNSKFIWIAIGGIIVAQFVIQLVFALKEHLL